MLYESGEETTGSVLELNFLTSICLRFVRMLNKHDAVILEADSVGRLVVRALWVAFFL